MRNYNFIWFISVLLCYRDTACMNCLPTIPESTVLKTLDKMYTHRYNRKKILKEKYDIYRNTVRPS